MASGELALSQATIGIKIINQYIHMHAGRSGGDGFLPPSPLPMGFFVEDLTKMFSLSVSPLETFPLLGLFLSASKYVQNL